MAQPLKRWSNRNKTLWYSISKAGPLVCHYCLFVPLRQVWSHLVSTLQQQDQFRMELKKNSWSVYRWYLEHKCSAHMRKYSLLDHIIESRVLQRQRTGCRKGVRARWVSEEKLEFIQENKERLRIYQQFITWILILIRGSIQTVGVPDGFSQCLPSIIFISLAFLGPSGDPMPCWWQLGNQGSREGGA